MKTSRKIKWRKLLLELVVVFLGVSGGFFLNNWRDSRNNIYLEKRYIEGFIQNADSNLVELKGIIREDSISLQQIHNYLDSLKKENFNFDSILPIISSIVNVSKATLVTSTYETIKYSGNLNILRDYSLKENIVAHHNRIEGVVYVDSYYQSYFNDFIMPFVIRNLDMSKGTFFDPTLKLKAEFFNVTAGYYSIKLQRMQAMENLAENTKKLKAELETYLANEF